MREYTNKLLEMVEEGLLDKDMVIMACVKYMSEDDVRGMMEANEMIEDEEEDVRLGYLEDCSYEEFRIVEIVCIVSCSLIKNLYRNLGEKR